MSLRRWGRKIKTRAEKGSPHSTQRHILRTEKVGEHEWKLHATKGWRVRRA